MWLGANNSGSQEKSTKPKLYEEIEDKLGFISIKTDLKPIFGFKTVKNVSETLESSLLIVKMTLLKEALQCRRCI